ncbi:type II toxin-antitoxin system YafQ family toxin [Lachnospiraceae bacterium 54-11]
MLDVRYSTKFKKDFKTCARHGYQIQLLQQAIDTLRIPAPLPEKNRNQLLYYTRRPHLRCFPALASPGKTSLLLMNPLSSLFD